MSQVMRGPRATIASITSTGNWTTSANQTLTVPSGNPGTIKFLNVVADFNAQYSKNNGTFTTFVTNDTLSVANADTLKFRPSPSGGVSCDVTDNTTSVTVGMVSL